MAERRRREVAVGIGARIDVRVFLDTGELERCEESYAFVDTTRVFFIGKILNGFSGYCFFVSVVAVLRNTP